MAGAEEDLENLPETGAVFTFGQTRFADNQPSRFWIRDDPVTIVACGDEHTAVVTTSGRLFTFGTNEWGQLGHGNTKTYTKPASIKKFKNRPVALVACGKSHTIALLEDGTCYGFGCGHEGQLGTGDTSSEFAPEEILALKNVPITQISAGGEHSAALTASGDVYMWGSNVESQLGLDLPEVTVQVTPRLISAECKFKQVSCGYNHTALISKSGELYVCGEADGGKLGLSPDQLEEEVSNNCVPRLTRVEYFANEEVSMVACGGSHTAVLTQDGRVFTFGEGPVGQLGLGPDVTKAQEPTQVDYLMGFRIVEVYCGHSHTALLSELNTVHCFGDGSSGKLGFISNHNTYLPVRIEKFAKFNTTLIACGGNHTIIQVVPNENWEEREDILNKKGRRLKFHDDSGDNKPKRDVINNENYSEAPVISDRIQNGSEHPPAPSTEDAPTFTSAREKRRKKNETQSLSFLGPGMSLPPLKLPHSFGNVELTAPVMQDFNAAAPGDRGNDRLPDRSDLEKQAEEPSEDEEESPKVSLKRNEPKKESQKDVDEDAPSVSEKSRESGSAGSFRGKLARSRTVSLNNEETVEVPVNDTTESTAAQSPPGPKNIVVQAKPDGDSQEEGEDDESVSEEEEEEQKDNKSEKSVKNAVESEDSVKPGSEETHQLEGKTEETENQENNAKESEESSPQMLKGTKFKFWLRRPKKRGNKKDKIVEKDTAQTQASENDTNPQTEKNLGNELEPPSGGNTPATAWAEPPKMGHKNSKLCVLL